MEFRVTLLLLGFASCAFGELNSDQQNGFNYQPNEGPSQQGFGQNVYGNKISQVETKPAVNQVEHQKTRLPVTTNGIPFATPFYGQFQPMQQMQGSYHPEVVSETAAPHPQRPSTTAETHNLALPPAYPLPYPYPGFVHPPSTLAPHTAYGNNAVQGSRVLQPQNQNGNFLSKPGESPNSITSPVAYSYPFPVPMPFPSYYPYPQMQYPR